jgi:hypothetical protein
VLLIVVSTATLAAGESDPKMRDNELEPREYINLLLRMSAFRYGVETKGAGRASSGSPGKDAAPVGRMTLPQAFERMTVELLLPNAAGLCTSISSVLP